MRHSFYGLMAYGLRPVRGKPTIVVALFAAILLAGSPPRAEEAGEVLIMAFGDSLTAGYELEQSQSFPAQLEAYLRDERGMDARVINAGVSGDTTSGGRARLDWVLDGAPRRPDLVILELGANDALRGIDPALAERNLEDIVTELTNRGIRVLLAGMKAPPNMGEDYENRFNAIYPKLAERHDLVFYPFFLENVAAKPELNLDDGMHPTGEGIGIIVEGIAPYVERALARPAPERIPSDAAAEGEAAR